MDSRFLLWFGVLARLFRGRGKLVLENLALRQQLTVLICGAVGSILGLLTVVPCIGYAKPLIPWIYTPWWLLLVMVVPSLAMCSLASIASVRSALTVEPGRVFRA